MARRSRSRSPRRRAAPATGPRCRGRPAGTSSPSGRIRPVCSASSTNAPGARRPRSGCDQRARSSTATVRARDDVDDRLVVDVELLALVARRRSPVSATRSVTRPEHLVGERDHVRHLAGLGLEEGDVGMPDDLARRQVDRAEGEPAVGVELDGVAARDRGAPAQRGEDRAGSGLTVAHRAEVVEQHAEGVAVGGRATRSPSPAARSRRRAAWRSSSSPAIVAEGCPRPRGSRRDRRAGAQRTRRGHRAARRHSAGAPPAGRGSRRPVIGSREARRSN